MAAIYATGMAAAFLGLRLQARHYLVTAVQLSRTRDIASITETRQLIPIGRPLDVRHLARVATATAAAVLEDRAAPKAGVDWDRVERVGHRVTVRRQRRGTAAASASFCHARATEAANPVGWLRGGASALAPFEALVGRRPLSRSWSRARTAPRAPRAPAQALLGRDHPVRRVAVRPRNTSRTTVMCDPSSGYSTPHSAGLIVTSRDTDVERLPSFEEVARHCDHGGCPILRDRLRRREVTEAVLRAHPPRAGRLR